MTLSEEILLVGAYRGGGILNVVYFRFSTPCESILEKCFRSMTLSKNRFNLTALWLPGDKPLVSWQFKQITSAPHCSANQKKKKRKPTSVIKLLIIYCLFDSQK